MEEEAFIDIDVGDLTNTFRSNDADFESFDLLDEEQHTSDQPNLIQDDRNNTEISKGGEEDDDIQDEDREENEVDPPEGFIRIRPSKFKLIPATVFVEYPTGLGMVRADRSALESLRDKELHYQCQWARNCIKNAFTRAGFTDSSDKWTVMWAQHQTHSTLRGLNCLQKVNHFPGSWALGRKDRLSRTIWAMKRLYPTEFNFHPESFVLPVDNHCLERCAKADVFHNKSANSRNKRLWIIKPVASSCGKGIKVISAEKAYALSKKNERKMLVQRYLGNPYLINKKKFDLRLYVLVTGVDPLRIYLHDEGLIRIATENFTTKNLKNQFIHLTNYSINKKSKHFCASSKFNFEGGAAAKSSDEEKTQQGRDGFKWTLKAFKTWLAERESPAIMEQTMDNVNSLIVKTILAAEPDLSHSLHTTANYRTNCFELFGFDVFLDRQLTPHLIEVNVSPSLAGSSPLDTYIKGVLVADVCHVTGFHAHEDRLLGKYFAAPSTPLSHTTTPQAYPPLHTHRPSSSAGYKASSNSSSSSTALKDDKEKDRDRDTEEVHINPFSFASLSQLMAGQDEWRKDMSMRNINMHTLSMGNGDAAWYMLLMVEDEFDRAEQSKFQKLHPAPESIDRYMALYKNARFSDQLLGRWVLGGSSGGKENKRVLPKRFQYVNAEVLEAGCVPDSAGAGGVAGGEGGTGTGPSPRGSGVALARARGRLSSFGRSVSMSMPPPRTKSAGGHRATTPNHYPAGLYHDKDAHTSGADQDCRTVENISASPLLADKKAYNSDADDGNNNNLVFNSPSSVQIQYNIGKETTVNSIGTRKYNSTLRYSNLKNNLKQQNIFLYDPIRRKKKQVFVPHKIIKNEHTSVVFEPSSQAHSHTHRKNANIIGDMYKHLLFRNSRGPLPTSASSGSGSGRGDGKARGALKVKPRGEGRGQFESLRITTTDERMKYIVK
jgi:tubulin polyglutamylase TTLL4